VEAPPFSLARLGGGSVSLADQRGRVVVMEFWATWCGPCRMSTPSLEVIAKRHRDQPVSVLLINAGESAETVRAWTGRKFTAASILLDADGEVRRRYGVAGIPRLLILDGEGRIVYDHSGYRGGVERNLTLILKQLMAERGAPDA
jgi:thiol-disulfide isomerase/thioredoxin